MMRNRNTVNPRISARGAYFKLQFFPCQVQNFIFGQTSGVILPSLTSYIRFDCFLRRGVGLYFKFQDSMGALIRRGALIRGARLFKDLRYLRIITY